MKVETLKRKWRKDIDKDTQRENNMDEIRLEEKDDNISTRTNPQMP